MTPASTDGRASAPATAPGRGERPRRRRAGGVSLYILTCALAVLTVSPLVMMLSGALKPQDAVFDGRLIPSPPSLEGVTATLTRLPFPTYLVNSLIIATVVTVASMLFHSMAAFALARLRFPGRDALFFGFVCTLLVSLPMILVPLFLVVRELGLLDTRLGIAAPMVFQVFPLFLLRQFYLRLPAELEDAARVDGCGYFRLYWSVALPLSRPILAALSIFVFLGAWNAFLWPLTVTADERLYVVQTGVASFQGENAGAWNAILAASTLAALPTIVLFVIFQRRIVESIKTKGLK